MPVFGSGAEVGKERSDIDAPGMVGAGFLSEKAANLGKFVLKPLRKKNRVSLVNQQVGPHFDELHLLLRS